MAGQSQSWRNLTLHAKMFIGLVVTAGTGVLLYGAIHQSSKNIAEFICYLGIARPGLADEGESARDYGHDVGELSVCPAGHSGTELLGNADSGLCLHPGAVFVSGPAQRDPGHFQCMRGRAFDRAGLLWFITTHCSIC